MEDKEILALYAAGDERAAVESDAKYGAACVRVAQNILDNNHEAEVCVKDALADAVPPKDTTDLGAYLAKATRNLAISRFNARGNAKRGDCHFQFILDELNQCAPAGSTGFGGGFDDETEAARLGAAINRFLRAQRGEARDVFICRYFYGETAGEIARRFGLTDNRVYALLRRTRLKLRKHLEKEGVRL